MLFVVIERYRTGQAAQIYDRLRRRGRMMPDDVRYLGSWVDTDFSRCFQVMEAPGQRSLDVWMAEWADLVEFECVPVYTSAEAAAMAADWESRKHLAPVARFKPRQWTRSHGEVVTEHILQTDDHAFDAAVTVRGEQTRLIGNAVTHADAAALTGRHIETLGHDRCGEMCETEWTEVEEPTNTP
jgi:Protein of unknown function (DUF3303)